MDIADLINIPFKASILDSVVFHYWSIALINLQEQFLNKISINIV